MEYLIAKWLHILSSTLLFGTGIGSAYYLFFASRGRDAKTVAAVARLVVRADWWFTATTAVFQPLSGWYLASLMQLPWSTRWLAWSLMLYTLAIACWLPVLAIQIRLHRLADAAAAAGRPLSPDYDRWLRVWVALGVPALVAFLAIFWLMVARPA